MTVGPYLMVAPTGARLSKSDHPGLPISPEEIAQTAKASALAGAHALHLHVRDAEGRHSLDAGRYREAMAAVAEAVPGMAIQVTANRTTFFFIFNDASNDDAIFKVEPIHQKPINESHELVCVSRVIL